MRAVPLVRRRDQRVATEGSDVDLVVGCEVNGIDVDAGPDRVRGFDDRREVGRGAEQVRRSGDRDPLGVLVDEIDHVLCRQLPRRRIERRQHVLRPGSVRRPVATA